MLEIEKLSYSYAYDEKVLRDVSLSLGKGEIVGLLGENGAGKTTLFKCVLGLLPHQSGTVRLDGAPLYTQRERIAYISGEGACVGRLTPAQTGEFLAQFYPRFHAERYKKLCRFFELADRPVMEMSKGERAKAELAAGFSRGADYILMDEPFNGKDVFTRQDFLRIIAGMLDGETILISTHLVSEVESFIDRVLILHKGELVADESMDALRQRTTLLDLLREKIGYDENRVMAFWE
ncbi:MAG: ABC transporter ATP-binding protein [Clostridia bacterium]|nr:ABC transporter ATP-binding protein [Clostridia bacterium]